MHERDMGGKSIFKLNPRTGVWSAQRSSVGDLARHLIRHKIEYLANASNEELESWRKAYEEQQLWSHPLLEAVRVLEGLEAGQRTLLKAKLKIRS